MNEDLKQLRRRMDGSDPFMTNGHQILKIRKRAKKVPDWATDNMKTQKLLLTAFPKLKTDPKQRARAARWGSIIHMFYRMNDTYSGIGSELHMTAKAVETVLWRIRRHASGRIVRHRGRPKKARVS